MTVTNILHSFYLQDTNLIKHACMCHKHDEASYDNTIIVDQKTGPQTHDHNSVKGISKIPPHLAYVATLPCETLASANQAINDKLQGSVATYLRCCGVVNNQIKTGLLLSSRIIFFNR